MGNTRRNKRLLKIENLHISFDVDSMDPIYAPGKFTPVRHGLNKDEVFKIFRFLFENYFISSVDVVEFNPVNDINGKTEK